MSYEEFEQQENEKRRRMMADGQARADKAYNEGLWSTLWWRAPWLYLALKRRVV